MAQNQSGLMDASQRLIVGSAYHHRAVNEIHKAGREAMVRHPRTQIIAQHDALFRHDQAGPRKHSRATQTQEGLAGLRINASRIVIGRLARALNRDNSRMAGNWLA